MSSSSVMHGRLCELVNLPQMEESKLHLSERLSSSRHFALA